MNEAAGARRRAITAEELVRQLAADPEYQQRRATADHERDTREAIWQAAERPIVDDLGAAGVHVGSVWDLVNTDEPYPAAIPVLVDHLRRGGYSGRVREGMARALAVGASAPYWTTLASLHEDAEERDEREGLAVALAASATRENAPKLIELISNGSLGGSRVHLVAPLAAIGGESGRGVLEGLRDDPELGREVKKAIRR